jgi:hypothetical protein
MEAWVTGAGGETGRAYYHRHVDGDREDAGPDELLSVMVRALAPRLAGARNDASEVVGERIGEWLAEAEQTGVSGWRALDVLYAQQRLRSWGRWNLPREQAPMVFAFAHPEVQRALISLAVTERRSDGFHRRFLARYAPELGLDGGRGRRLAGRLAGRAGGALRRLGVRQSRSSLLAGHWDGRPRFRSWVADELLVSPLLVDSLGRTWVDRVREGFQRGDPELEALALWAAAPAALDRSLVELNRGA